jgi:replicative DNA helicase
MSSPESDFYNDAHRLIYQHINLLGSHGKPADVITLAESLGSVQKLDYVGGMAYVGGAGAKRRALRTSGLTRRSSAGARCCGRLAAVGAEISDSAFTRWAARRAAARRSGEEGSTSPSRARGQVGFQEIRPLLTKVVERIEGTLQPRQCLRRDRHRHRLYRSRSHDIRLAAR